MNWVERRRAQEGTIPGVWESLYLEMRETVKSYDELYACRQRAATAAEIKGDCLHVTFEPLWPGKVDAPERRSIDICLDLARRSVFSRIAGKEILRISFSADSEGKARLTDHDGNVLTFDQVSELFLEPFFFPST